jgi:hypothetical protein
MEVKVIITTDFTMGVGGFFSSGAMIMGAMCTGIANGDLPAAGRLTLAAEDMLAVREAESDETRCPSF